jgi:hypothetical protein
VENTYLESKGRFTGTAIDYPDIKAYAESFSNKGYSPTILNGLKSQLELNSSYKKLSAMEIKVDSSVNKKLLEKHNSFWKGDQHVEGY